MQVWRSRGSWQGLAERPGTRRPSILHAGFYSEGNGEPLNCLEHQSDMFRTISFSFWPEESQLSQTGYTVGKNGLLFNRWDVFSRDSLLKEGILREN